jgi:hypothetical protein
MTGITRGLTKMKRFFQALLPFGMSEHAQTDTPMQYEEGPSWISELPADLLVRTPLCAI